MVLMTLCRLLKHSTAYNTSYRQTGEASDCRNREYKPDMDFNGVFAYM
jgi:hypothetical protein